MNGDYREQQRQERHSAQNFDEFARSEPRVKPVPRPTSQVPEKSEKYITLRIKPRSLERTFFVLIICILIGIVLFNPFHRGCPATKEATLPTTTGLSVQEQEKSVENQSKIATLTSVTPKINVTPATNTILNTTMGNIMNANKNKTNITSNYTVNQSTLINQTSSQKAEEGPIDPSLVDFTVNTVDIVKKTENWAKVTRINVTISNQGYRLRPLIKIYTWDSKTQNILSDHQEGSDWKYDVGISRGTTKTLSIDTSISYSDFDLEKTIKLKLFDSRTSKLVKEATKKFKIE